MFLDSKRELREHIDENHRITDSKVAAGKITKRATLSSSIKVDNELWPEKI